MADQDDNPARELDDAGFEALLESSSLGTPAARALRDRTTSAELVRMHAHRSQAQHTEAALHPAAGADEPAAETQPTPHNEAGEAVARKEALITEAEGLAEETTRWKHADDRFSAMLDEWKVIRGTDRRTDDALWRRFARARETFTRRREAHLAELAERRAAARASKEELVTEAESLAESDDWGPTATRYKELMADWKAAGRTTREADDALWARFRAAQDTFFSRRSEAFSARDAELVDNAARKEELLAEAGRIDLGDVDAARAALRGVQERWDEIGKVPRDRMREFATRLKEAEDRVRAAVDRRWSASNPETDARLDQFRERVAQFEAQAEKARAAGDRRRADEADRQAAQWREWLTAAEEASQSGTEQAGAWLGRWGSHSRRPSGSEHER